MGAASALLVGARIEAGSDGSAPWFPSSVSPTAAIVTSFSFGAVVVEALDVVLVALVDLEPPPFSCATTSTPMIRIVTKRPPATSLRRR